MTPIPWLVRHDKDAMEELVSATEITCDVAIVGAGPTGLTLANLLGQAGVDVVLIERNATTVQAPRAVSIDDESLRTMQACGLEQAAIADIALDYGAHYFTPSGICFAKVEPKNREYGYPRRSAFLQPVLEATLRRGLERFPNVRQHFSHTVEGIEEREDEVQLSITGPDGSPLTLRTKWLAGCDGGRSLARKHVGAELVGETYGEKWLIVDLADTKERMRQTRVLCNPDRPAICLPDRTTSDAMNSCCIRAKSTRKWNSSTTSSACCGKWPGRERDHRTPASLSLSRASLRQVAHKACISRRRCSAPHTAIRRSGHEFRRARCTCPLMAIDSGHKGRTGTWHLRQLPFRARAACKIADRNGAKHWQGDDADVPCTGVFRALGFRLMRFVPPLHAYFAQMKYKPKPFYKDGFIVGAMQSKLAGRMIYQPNLEHLDRSRSRLDDLTGSEFALIAYGDNAQANIAANTSTDFGIPNVRRIAIVPMRINIDRAADPSIIAVRDIDDLLAGQMPEGETLVLVRPDRYIMAATHAPANGITDAASLARSVRELVEATRR